MNGPEVVVIMTELAYLPRVNRLMLTTALITFDLRTARWKLLVSQQNDLYSRNLDTYPILPGTFADRAVSGSAALVVCRVAVG